MTKRARDRSGALSAAVSVALAAAAARDAAVRREPEIWRLPDLIFWADGRFRARRDYRVVTE